MPFIPDEEPTATPTLERNFSEENPTTFRFPEEQPTSYTMGPGEVAGVPGEDGSISARPPFWQRLKTQGRKMLSEVAAAQLDPTSRAMGQWLFGQAERPANVSTLLRPLYAIDPNAESRMTQPSGALPGGNISMLDNPGLQMMLTGGLSEGASMARALPALRAPKGAVPPVNAWFERGRSIGHTLANPRESLESLSIGYDALIPPETQAANFVKRTDSIFNAGTKMSRAEIEASLRNARRIASKMVKADMESELAPLRESFGQWDKAYQQLLLKEKWLKGNQQLLLKEKWLKGKTATPGVSGFRPEGGAFGPPKANNAP